MMKTVSLGTLIASAPLKKCGNGKYPVLSMTMHDGIMLQSDRFKKYLASSDTSNYKIVHRNQLVEGFPIDEGVIYVQKIVDDGIMSPAYRVWDIDVAKIEPDYLELALHSGKAMQYYRTKLRGTTARRRSLPTPTLLAMEIPLPSREEQRHSIMMLNDAQEAINTLNMLQAEIDNIVKSRFIEMFGDPVTNPMGWEEHRLDEYIRFLTSGSRGWSKYFSDTGEIFITIKNVKNNRISLDNVQYVTPPDNAEAQRTKVREGDLLISITADLGRTGVVSKEIEERGAYINQHLTCIRLKQDRINPGYVSYFMESDAGKRQFEAKNQAAVKAGLNFDAIKSLKLLVPPLELQNEFMSFVELADKSELVIRELLEQHQLLKEALMQKYFG